MQWWYRQLTAKAGDQLEEVTAKAVSTVIATVDCINVSS